MILPPTTGFVSLDAITTAKGFADAPDGGGISGKAPVLRAAAPEKTLPSSPGAGPGVLTAHGVSEPSTEDNLLRVIALQSNPSRAGAFSGLSGMRQLRQTETLASLNNLTAAPSPAGIPGEDDSPDHSLGEISVGVSPSIGVNKRVGQ